MQQDGISQNNYAEQKLEEYILYDSTYIKFQRVQTTIQWQKAVEQLKEEKYLQSMKEDKYPLKDNFTNQ